MLRHSTAVCQLAIASSLVVHYRQLVNEHNDINVSVQQAPILNPSQTADVAHRGHCAQTSCITKDAENFLHVQASPLLEYRSALLLQC